MNPTKKWAWFDQQRPEYKEEAELEVQQIWNNFYKDWLPTPFSSSVTINYPESDTDDDCLDNKLFSEVDPYTEYCQAQKIPDQSCKPKDLANWWWAHLQMKVSRMAWDTLAIPAMSAECERIFSSASHLVTSLLSSLQDEAIKANECLKSWFTQESEQEEWVALGAEGRLDSRGKRHGGQIEELWGERLLQEQSNRMGWELREYRGNVFF